MTHREELPPRLRGRKALGVFLWMAAAVLALGYAFFPSGADEPEGRVAEARDPRLPDLTMAPVELCCIGVTEDGRWELRFGATIVNIGEGDFMVRARRWSRFSSWTLEQFVDESIGGFTGTEARGAELIWGGDGHNHWHIADIETHWLETMDGSEIIGTVIKPGFCFFDTTPYGLTLPGAPDEPNWSATNCGTRQDTALLMGLSIGWGDNYPWVLFEQAIDVTDIEPGRYRIRAVADPENWFRELDETNNGSWTVIDISLRDDGMPIVERVDESPAPGNG